MHAVRRDLQAAADAGGVGPGLEHLGIDAGLFQENRRGRAGDAAADDQGFAGILSHLLLHASGRVTKVKLLIILVAKILVD